MRTLGRFFRSRGGGVAVIAAASIGAMLAFAAVAVDLGSIFLQTRQLQGMADLAAIGAANDLTNAQAAAAATANANHWPGRFGQRWWSEPMSPTRRSRLASASLPAGQRRTRRRSP